MHFFCAGKVELFRCKSYFGFSFLSGVMVCRMPFEGYSFLQWFFVKVCSNLLLLIVIAITKFYDMAIIV
jgi:hypothetical protein